jgi:hypothetical protein
MLVVLLLLVAGNLSAKHGQSSMERQEFMQLFYRFSNPRIAPKVLLPGRGLKERLKHTLRQK